MFVDNEIKTILAKHIILAFSTLIVCFVLLEGFATIVTEKPIMLKVFFFDWLTLLFIYLLLLVLLKFFQNFKFELMFLLLGIISKLLLLFLFPLLKLLPLILPGLRLHPHRLGYFSWILDDLVSVRLFEPKVVSSFMLIYLSASLLILLINFINCLVCFLTIDMLAQPLLVQ